MMQERAIRALRSVCGVGVLLGSLAAACAGTDTPARTEELEQQIASEYAPGQVGATGGSGGGNGTGGSGGGGGMMAGMAGGGSMTAGAGGGGSGDCNGFALLQMKCGGGSCHGGASPGFLTNFALDEATAEALEGEPSAGAACTTDISPVFDAENPAASLVIKKASGTASCGNRMPPSPPYLEPADIQCIQTWIGSL